MRARQQQFTKIVLDVAGTWRAREDVVAAIGERSAGWKYAGRLLVHTATHRTFHLDVIDREAALGGTAALEFRYLSPEARAALPDGLSLRLTAPAGSMDMARLALGAAAALAEAGGTHVTCRSSGGVVAADRLGGWSVEGSPGALARAFVALHDEPGRSASCGMQSLGLADAVIDAEPGCARSVLELFTADLLEGRLKPRAGGRFAPTPGSSGYALALEPCSDVGREDPRFNPYGRWRLKADA